MDSNGSLWVLIVPYASLLVLMVPYKSLFVFLDPHGSLCVLIGLHSSGWTPKGPYRSLCSFVESNV